jgi:hypothetical protein
MLNDLDELPINLSREAEEAGMDDPAGEEHYRKVNSIPQRERKEAQCKNT